METPPQTLASQGARIIFRLDSGEIIGAGHLMRSLTLGEELRKKGHCVEFASRDHHGHLLDKIRNAGFELHILPPFEHPITLSSTYAEWVGPPTEDVLQTFKDCTVKYDYVIVDHHGIDSRWEKLARQFAHSIVVFNDIATREHDCDLIVDQNFFEDFQDRYDAIVGPSTKRLLGPQYAMIHPRFREIRQQTLDRKNTGIKLLITFGGSDPTNETFRVLQAVSRKYSLFSEILAVIGAGNSHRREIENLAASIPNAKTVYNTTQIPELLASSTLVIMAGGHTTWERCCMGVPAIAIAIADNQTEIASALAAYGCQKYLGIWDQVGETQILDAVEELISNRRTLEEMGSKSSELVDGLGIFRVIEEIENLNRS